MTGLLIMTCVALVVLYFNDAWRSLDRARRAAREVCKRNALQFLDGSVVQTSVHLERNNWQWLIARSYRFEFTTNGTDRHAGHLVHRGRRLHVVSIDNPDGSRTLDVDRSDQP